MAGKRKDWAPLNDRWTVINILHFDPPNLPTRIDIMSDWGCGLLSYPALPFFPHSQRFNSHSLA